MSSKYMTNEAVNIYKLLTAANKTSGTFHKGLFHLHTPASSDYKLFGDKEANKIWNEYTEENIYSRCCEISPAFQMGFPSFEDSKELLEGYKYNSFKECLAYYCLALKLISVNISYAVVTDHHVLEGCAKLQWAIDNCTANKTQKHISIIHGIEISCADKVHVVVIYDHTDAKSESEIKKWLNENLVSEKEGVFRPSYDVLEHFNKAGFTAYIAHINSSEIFDEHFLTLSYKKKLFSLSDTCLIGVRSSEHIEKTNQLINNLMPDKECIYVLDNDSHSIDTVDREYTYILSQTVDYKNIRLAFADYDVCVRFSLPTKPNTAIIGIGIPDSDKGFLHSPESKSDDSFIINFATGLNFLIGGRGSGKSTVINIISLLLGGKSHDSALIELLCNHPTIYVLFFVKGKEYFSVFNQPCPDYEESFCEYLKRQTRDHYFHNRNGKYYRYSELYQYLRDKHVDLYCIDDISKNLWSPVLGKNKTTVLRNVFNNAYSINEIINYIRNDQLSDFIADMLWDDRPNLKLNCLPNKDETIINSIKLYKKWYANKVNEINRLLNNFNATSHSTIKLSLAKPSQGNKYANILFHDYESSPHGNFYDSRIFNQDVLEYFQQIIDSIGIISTLELIAESNYSKFLELQEFQPIYQNSNNGINKNSLSQKEQREILSKAFKEATNKDSINEILQTHASETLRISLEFNLSSNNESITAQPKYKKIEELSMGQKVVAILSFILLYGSYANDTTPLVIDQPEDNLDSQYIYENLVKDLRKAKQYRQVIIATHNPTLVTNCKAEQVIVLKSDNNHGWVEMSGYPTRKNITNRILQYLEGGKKSFNHRALIYSDHLQKT